MKPVSWRLWAIFAALGVIYVGAGFIYGATAPLNVLFDIASVAAFSASLLFVAVYTVRGLRGTGKWWRNTVGTFLVMATGSQMAVAGIPAFAVIFNDGLINTQWWGWCWIGAYFLSGAMVLAMAVLWLRSKESRT
jgi:hypothetical protein